MKPVDIVNDLLEGYPGASQSDLDEIMATIYDIVDDMIRKEADYGRTGSTNVKEFVDRFNSSGVAKKFNVWFFENWDDLSKMWRKYGNGNVSPKGLATVERLKNNGVRGAHITGWSYIISPPIISRAQILQLGIRGVIAHEIVHQKQYFKMPANKHKEIITNRQKIRKWRENPYVRSSAAKHETPAYAASLVNDLQSNDLTKAEVLQALRKGSAKAPLSQSARTSISIARQLSKDDPKAYKRFLKHAAGYAGQLPENMKPVDIVDTLLESLPGRSQSELDEIMNIIRSVVDRVKSGNPQVDIPRFEQEVNPLLEPYNVKFSSNDSMLLRYHMPARAGLEGAVVQTPSRISRDGFSNVPLMLSHELVHVDQMSRAFHGNAMKMYKSAHDRILPGGKFDPQAYQTDPHEVTAYARSLIDQMRQRKGTKDQALGALKSGAGNRLKNVSTKSHHRFLKAAAGYAQDLPSK